MDYECNYTNNRQRLPGIDEACPETPHTNGFICFDCHVSEYWNHRFLIKDEEKIPNNLARAREEQVLSHRRSCTKRPKEKSCSMVVWITENGYVLPEDNRSNLILYNKEIGAENQQGNRSWVGLWTAPAVDPSGWF